MKPWTLRGALVLWHGESPGMKITVQRWLPWWRRSPIATLSEMCRATVLEDRTR